MSENLTLHLSRVYKQSRKRIFDAWTQPEQFAAWFAPGQFEARSVEIDPREGGVLRVAWVGPSPQNGAEICVVLSGVYRQLVPGELLRFTWKIDAELVEDTLVTVEFNDVAGGTEVSLTQERISSEQILNRNRGGWGSCLEKLAQISDRVPSAA